MKIDAKWKEFAVGSHVSYMRPGQSVAFYDALMAAKTPAEVEQAAEEFSVERWSEIEDLSWSIMRDLIGSTAEQLQEAANEPNPGARWYVVDKSGMATLCANEDDARAMMVEYAQIHPTCAPYRIAHLVEVDAP